ncbi:MAG: pyridoxal-phosphate dependent enzyme, partial [Nitrospinota bacterium]
MERPSLEDILKARQNISRYLRPTPFRQIPPLGKMLGCELYLKFECMQPTGAFKVRGGLN